MKSLSQKSDEKLCVMVSEGNRAAEECLVIRYRRMVRVYTRPYFLAGGDSEDLLQEGMIGLLSAIRAFDAKRDVRFQRYAETCIQNRLRSIVRSAASGKHEPLNQAISLDLSDGGKSDSYCEKLGMEKNPEEALINREELSLRVDNLVDELSAFEEKVLRFYLGGLSYSQIAFLTGRQVKAVDNAIQRIRRKAIPYFSSGGNSVS